jgi:DNA-binding MarR family transcriptional regulator
MYNKDMEITSGQMCEDMFLLMGRIKTGMITVAEEYDLTPVQVAAMYAVLKGDTQMGQVANRLHCDASNATGIVDRLVARGLVRRQESEQDRRVKILQLTEKGSATIDAIITKLPTATGCSKLSSQECSNLHETINKIAA